MASMMVLMVATVVGVMVRVVVTFMVVFMMSNTMVTPKTFAQGELSGQLSDGLPLVKDGFLLPHKAFAKVQDGGLSFIRHHASMGAPTMIMRATTGSMGHSRWGIAARIRLWRNRGANKLGANAITVFYAW